ncbi:hypothetical protein CQA66_08370 [Helicobacter aurati]|uniref:DUF2184 domain-containing protein n=1 Tax=Helicobacter aurati TaxID=137778 RepID=A0A3D8IZB6_9HELI|nr:hypothetical protein [Helicobacter aurati]RDU70413.1 hypothetical protein CQA66_08370 [Helicobacter aurati]
MNQSLIKFYQQANPKGYFNFLERQNVGARILDGGYALQNVDVGLGSALSQVNNKIIDMVFQKLKIEEIVGERVRLMEFSSDDIETPIIQYAGEPSSYNDFVNPNSLAMNVRILKTKQIRDSINIRVGDLESEQLSRVGVNEIQKAMGGALNILLEAWNKTAFFGTGGEDNRVYGILDFPDLSEYVTLKTKLSSPTYDDMLSDIQTLIGELQTQNNHIGDDTIMKLALSPALSALLKLEGKMQKSLKTYLKENYPNLEIVINVNEFKGAYQNKSVMLLIAETPDDGSTEKRSVLLPYSELALMSRVSQKETHISQNISIGHGGAVVIKPQNIARGVVADGNR